MLNARALLNKCLPLIAETLAPAGYHLMEEGHSISWGYRKQEGEAITFVDLQPHRPADCYVVNLAFHPTYLTASSEAYKDVPYIPRWTAQCFAQGRLKKVQGRARTDRDNWFPEGELPAFAQQLKQNLLESIVEVDKLARFFMDPDECFRTLTVHAMGLELERSNRLSYLSSFSKRDKAKIAATEALPRGLPAWITRWEVNSWLIMEFLVLTAKRQGRLGLAREYIGLFGQHKVEEMRGHDERWCKRLTFFLPPDGVPGGS